MTSTLKALAALAVLASTAPAGASEATSTEATRQGVTVPSVISVAYRDPRIATSSGETFRQGGFTVSGAVQWLPFPETTAPEVAFKVPGVISAAYGAPSIASNTSATAVKVRWLLAAPGTAEANAEAIRLGAL